MPAVGFAWGPPRTFRLLTSTRKLVFRRGGLGEVREEVEIWDLKIHRTSPVLLPHEKGIRAIPAARQPAQQTSPATPP
ncbi:hypothetical protein [Streptomyces sp. B21-083]|uniref:hypothetical protein n=1 Tax=Streptomyces sp. B21-083 TaxID=3039410 RepID=UPI002FEE9323